MSIRDKVLKTDLQERYLETYEDYIKNVLPKALLSNNQWLDDIIEGRKEQELILYQDKDFILSKVEDGIVLKLLTSRKYKNNYFKLLLTWCYLDGWSCQIVLLLLV